jgi:uridine kinase
MMIVGICGGTGSGKTTVSRKIVEAVGEDKILLLAQDAYYKDRSHLPFEQRVELNFDHPDAIDSSLLGEHLDLLKRGQPISQPIYDFTRHVRQNETRQLEPKPIVIVEGILIFESETLRRRFDLKIYVEADPDVRFIRRLRRDLSKRGRSMDSVIEQYLQTVRPMHLKFVEPGRRLADIILPEGGHNAAGMNFLIRVVKDCLATKDLTQTEHRGGE